MNETGARTESIAPAVKIAGIFRWIMMALVAVALVLDLLVLIIYCL